MIWNWFIVKNYFNPPKYLFWGYSKWWQIKQSAFGLKRGQLSNVLVAEKYKPCEIYRKMYDVYREVF